MPSPRLLCELNLGTLTDLPPWSAGAALSGRKRDDAELLDAIAAAGFDGVQGGDPASCRTRGLSCSGGGRIDRPDQADTLAQGWAAEGLDYVAIHLGTEIMPDHAVDALVDAVLAASARYDVPIYIETHRATATQDGWRTVQLTRRHPDIRFNGDFSHWYTGHEMPYGDFAAKLDFYAPVFERVQVFHGRIGNSSHMQVGILDGRNEIAVEHFKQIWQRCFAAYIAAGDYRRPLVFAPELLQPAIRYAREFPDGDGGYREESDRWLEALRYCEIVRELFANTLAATPAR